MSLSSSPHHYPQTMPGLFANTGPTYISSHSADVVLSETRPIRLKADALCSINTILDEFLYNILSAARSLQTDKLRLALLNLLPTNLGKEALLEAEVEIRGYWERTNPGRKAGTQQDDDSKLFSLDWTFELLRMKCEAYSTLNDSDEDPLAESRLYERMAQAGVVIPPNQILVAPASLYLTAIIESVCEHILSNVGRVVARDSSRTGATIQDLYIALCEDDNIYGLFRSMNVYEQIEIASKTPKPRRSKSFTQSEKSRTASPQLDFKESPTSSHKSHLSTEAAIPSLPYSTPVLRSSLEKARGMKKFISNGLTSGSNDREADPVNSHKKSESVRSIDTKAAPTANSENERVSFEDAEMLQEFDDLMRSGSTMKVSLTPDRLRTMEVYKQEKDQRSRRPAPLPFKTDTDSSLARVDSRKKLHNQVGSILEDEEENNPPKSSPNRSRHGSVSGPSPSAGASSHNRIRSISSPARGIGARLIGKSSRAVPPSPPSSFPHPLAISETSLPSSTMPAPTMRHADANAMNEHDGPKRTRKIQRNRESLDLDDIMNGSGDEDNASSPDNQSPQPATPHSGGLPVSKQTRELMDFLAEGPPNLGLNNPSPPNTSVSIETGKPKNSGRLQRMMSKLSMSSEKSRILYDDAPRTSGRLPTTTRPPLPKPPVGGLANRPIPPRFPPSSPTYGSTEYDTSSYSSANQAIRQALHTPPPFSPTQPSILNTPYSRAQPASSSLEITSKNTQNPSNGTPFTTTSNEKTPTPSTVGPSPRQPTAPSRSTPSLLQDTHQKQTRPIPPAPGPVPTSGHITQEAALDMRRLITNASNADECRVILDMFLARAGIPLSCASPAPSVISPPPLSAVARDHADGAVPNGNTNGQATSEAHVPTPSSLIASNWQAVKRAKAMAEDLANTKAMETSLVDMFLGDKKDAVESWPKTAPTNSVAFGSVTQAPPPDLSNLLALRKGPGSPSGPRLHGPRKDSMKASDLTNAHHHTSFGYSIPPASSLPPPPAFATAIMSHTQTH